MSTLPSDSVTFITTAYVAMNALRVLSYIPQIVAVYRDGYGAHAISLWTWSFWLLANASTAVYAMWVMPDAVLAGVGISNGAANAIVIGLTVWKRCASDAPAQWVADGV